MAHKVVYKLFKAKDIALALFVALFCCLPSSPAAEEAPVEYQLKAELLERFTQYIDWPESSMIDPSVPFTIGIAGKNPFGSYLDRFSKINIKGKKVVVVEFSDVSEMDHCQVLFVTKAEDKNLAAILSRTEGKPILTVGDTEGFAKRGVLINFYRYDDYVRFEVNQSSVNKSGLKFSSRLLKLARFVEEK